MMEDDCWLGFMMEAFLGPFSFSLSQRCYPCPALVCRHGEGRRSEGRLRFIFTNLFELLLQQLEILFDALDSLLTGCLNRFATLFLILVTEKMVSMNLFEFVVCLELEL